MHVQNLLHKRKSILPIKTKVHYTKHKIITIFHMHSFRFDKGTQVLNFFAQKEGTHINYMKAIKLCWAADRYHVRKYGRSVTDDSYKAMKYGPVASGIKDIVTFSSFLTDVQKKYIDQYLKKNDQNSYKTIKNIDSDVFSLSDMEALEFSYQFFGKFDQYTLATFSHAYPEWKRFEEYLTQEGMKVFDMTYEDFFKDPLPNAQELEKISYKDHFAESPEVLSQAKQSYYHKKEIDTLWN